MSERLPNVALPWIPYKFKIAGIATQKPNTVRLQAAAVKLTARFLIPSNLDESSLSLFIIVETPIKAPHSQLQFAAKIRSLQTYKKKRLLSQSHNVFLPSH